LWLHRLVWFLVFHLDLLVLLPDLLVLILVLLLLLRELGFQIDLDQIVCCLD
jgi:hypothetical protein